MKFLLKNTIKVMRKMLDDKKISNIVLQFGFSIKKTKNVGYKIVLNSQFLLNDVYTSYRGSRVHDLRRKLIFHFLSTNRKKKTPTFLIRLCAFSTAQRVTFSTFFFSLLSFICEKGGVTGKNANQQKTVFSL